MAISEILIYPDPRLRTPAVEVIAFDDELRKLADGMLETMYDAGGIGLAAPQINVSKRVVVVDLGEEIDMPEVLVNPSYQVLQEAEPVMIAEGCLSVPLLHVEVERYSAIEFSWQDLDGNRHSEKPDNSLRCICLQHELDHLDGRLLVDYLSRMQRERYKRLLRKPQDPPETLEMTAIISGATASGKLTGLANKAKPQPNDEAAESYATIRKSRGRDSYERKITV